MISKDTEGKFALVTGGTGGVGFRIAERLAQHGAIVTVTGRSTERGNAALAELKKICPQARFVAGDCSNYDVCIKAVEAATQESGKLDLLVSAGAEGPFGPTLFHAFTPEQIVASYQDRFLPRVFPVHAALPALRASGEAAVLLVTTDAGRHATPGESIIGAVGASMIMLTKALAREFSGWKIRVNGIALTLTSDTPSWDRIFAKQSFENNLFSKALSRFPSGRAPTSTEAAQVAHFLLSPLASQVTGQTISVNGGLSFAGW